MDSLNSNNFIFLKDFRPELYKLSLKMEKDLLITPISMLAYSTRFLEYILYDIAKLNDYKVNKEIGFVNNVYELVQKDYIDFHFGDLLIKAYVFRNTSIHNTNISKALKYDRNVALELNKRLFDIAETYYKNLTKSTEKHYYLEPLIEGSEKEFSTIIRQKKLFDFCIICGSSNKQSKSNFCVKCDNLLNARDVLSKIIIKKGKNSLLKREDFDYPFKNELIKYLISKNILEQVGNNYYFVNDNLDDFFILTDEFMEIDKFLFDFRNNVVENPKESKFYTKNEYPYEQISKIIDGFYVLDLIQFLKMGFSLEYSLQQIDIEKSDLIIWYDIKKSEFIDGNKDKIFVEFNELLIDDYFKSIENNDPKNISISTIEFWSEYFDGFSNQYVNKLGKYKLNLFIELLKMNNTKEYVFNQLDMDQDDLNLFLSRYKILADEYFDEINRRKTILLSNVNDLSLNESIEKSKFDTYDLEICRDEFLNGTDNEFYQKLAETLIKRYLNFRERGLDTDEICSKLTIEKSELNLWLDNDSFKNLNEEYSKIRLKLFKKATSNNKSLIEILNDLEITEEEFNEYIELGKQGIDGYVEYYNIFQKDYYPTLIEIFLQEFREKSNLNVALKNSNLTKKDLETHLNSNEKLYNEFIGIKIDKIANNLVKKGKVNNKLFKKLDFSKEEYHKYKEEIDEKVIEKQVIILTKNIPDGDIVFNLCKNINCDLDTFFDWIYVGTLGDKKFEELAFEYWDEHLFFINDANSDLRDDVPENVVRNNFKPKVRYDFDHWKKWGLIDKRHIELKVEDVKDILEKSDYEF